MNNFYVEELTNILFFKKNYRVCPNILHKFVHLYII